MTYKIYSMAHVESTTFKMTKMVGLLKNNIDVVGDRIKQLEEFWTKETPKIQMWRKFIVRAYQATWDKEKVDNRVFFGIIYIYRYH